MIVMVQYVNKSALVAKIKKRFDEYSSSILKHYDACKEAKAQELGKILIILDTLDVKEVNLKKEAELIANGIMIDVQANKYNTVVYNTKRNDFNHSHLMLAARKGIELGLKASNPTTAVDKENEWHESSVKPPFTLTMDGNRYSNPMLCYDKFGNYCIAQYARMQTGYCGWYDGYEEVSITHWKELKALKGK